MDRTFRDILRFVDLAHDWGVREIRFSPLRVNFDFSLAREDIFRDINKIRDCRDLMRQAKARAAELGMEIIDRTAGPTRSALRDAGAGAASPKPERKQKGPKKDLPVCRAPWGSLWMN